MKKDKWTPFPKNAIMSCKKAKKERRCDTCFYFFICYPEEAPSNNK